MICPNVPNLDWICQRGTLALRDIKHEVKGKVILHLQPYLLKQVFLKTLHSDLTTCSVGPPFPKAMAPLGEFPLDASLDKLNR